jgi:hypothetical protein
VPHSHRSPQPQPRFGCPHFSGIHSTDSAAQSWRVALVFASALVRAGPALTQAALHRVTDLSLGHYTREDLAAVGAGVLSAYSATEEQRHVGVQQRVLLSKERLQQHRKLQTILEVSSPLWFMQPSSASC